MAGNRSINASKLSKLGSIGGYIPCTKISLNVLDTQLSVFTQLPHLGEIKSPIDRDSDQESSVAEASQAHFHKDILS